MKFDSYSYVFGGLDSVPLFADASAGKGPVFAVVEGTEAGAAKTLINSLEELGRTGVNLQESDISSVFEKIHPVLQNKNAVVSAAGAFYVENDLHLFNIGNARAVVFRNGYMIMHSEDHSEAYRAYKSSADREAAYDQIRSQTKRQELWKVLGFGRDGRPQFYKALPLENKMVVLLCTEPFWRYLSVMEMELDYRKSAGPEEWLKIMVRRVLMRANTELDNENFAVSVFMKEE